MRSDEVNPSSIRQLTKYRHTLRSTSFAEKNSYMAENNGAAIARLFLHHIIVLLASSPVEIPLRSRQGRT